MSTSAPRIAAVQTAQNRIPRHFERPQTADGRVLTSKEYFGVNTFSDEQMRARLSGDVYRKYRAVVDGASALDRPTADAIAKAVFEWAHERGATHFCHWFQPLTGLTAEKHDAFLEMSDARAITKFTGAQLIQSEPDASSFPSGGMRTTFEARGYTAWDPTSPMFLVERTNGSTLCVPSVFFSYYGHALDKKTPLLRSMEAINREATALLSMLGENAKRVTATCGPEQEYFLVDKAYAMLRPDLIVAGRTLQGSRPPKGQTLEDHYFGSIPSRVLAFMQELETELYKLGVPAKTRHNEVAPSQFELAVVYGEANLAADHNQLVMELMKKVAERHSFMALLHEKPFAGVNGSGKHLNWSLATDTGHNLLEPGATPGDNLRFLAFLSGVVLGVWRHSAVLRAAIASHGNDFRLGANEAPPAIISVFLGEQLTKITDAIIEGREAGKDPETAMIELGINRLPSIAKDSTDRNRTSPFAFTGNKFEFRAVGANMSISLPITAVNTVVADGLAQIHAWANEEGGTPSAVLNAVKKALTESKGVRFEGNNYADSWQREAEKRGLPNLRNTPDAVERLNDPAVHALFTRHDVYKEGELKSLYEVKVHQYVLSVDVEVDAMRTLIDQIVIPAGIEERTAAAIDLKAVVDLGDAVATADLGRTRSRYEDLCKRLAGIHAARAELDAATEAAGGLEGLERARFYAMRVTPAIQTLREAADAIEEKVADSRWPIPRYREMLFQN
jgi:glutamine synthetase